MTFHTTSCSRFRFTGFPFRDNNAALGDRRLPFGAESGFVAQGYR